MMAKGGRSSGLDCDVLVVGAGIAGLTCAVRLAATGAAVLVVERGRPGSGATLSNPGIVHGGALYAELHPHISRACGDAVAAYRASLPDAVLSEEPSRYVAQPDRMRMFRQLWHRLGIAHEAVGADDWPPDFRGEARRSVDVSLAHDLVLDTRRALVDLTARCLAAGVTIVPDTPIRGLVRRGDVVTGARTGADQDIGAAQTVLTSGLGTAELLGSVTSRVAPLLKSRLSAMAALPSTVTRPVMALDYGGICLVPGPDGHALVTRYGVPVRWLAGRLPAATAAAELRAVQEGVSFLLRADAADPREASIWPAAKTEMAQGTADGWGVEPAHAMVDHRAAEGVSGLWTVIPGKMTLALHASQELAGALTGSPHPLVLPTVGGASCATPLAEAEALVEPHPWRHVDATDAPSPATS